MADTRLLGAAAAALGPGQITVQLTEDVSYFGPHPEASWEFAYLRVWAGGVGGTEILACSLAYGAAVLQAALSEVWHLAGASAAPARQVLVVTDSQPAAAAVAESAGYTEGTWRWLRDVSDLRGIGPKDATVHVPHDDGWGDRADFPQLMVLLHRLEQVGVSVRRD